MPGFRKTLNNNGVTIAKLTSMYWPDRWSSREDSNRDFILVAI